VQPEHLMCALQLVHPKEIGVACGPSPHLPSQLVNGISEIGRGYTNSNTNKTSSQIGRGLWSSAGCERRELAVVGIRRSKSPDPLPWRHHSVGFCLDYTQE
jgi:hypothetical protein